MIPVGVGKEHIKFFFLSPVQGFSQAPDTGTGIDDDDLSGIRLDFKAGSIPPVLNIIAAGYGNGPPGSPTFYSHDPPAS